MTTENTTPAETPEGERQAYSPEQAARSAAIFDASMALGHPKHYRTEYATDTKDPASTSSGVFGVLGAPKPGGSAASRGDTQSYGRELVDVAAFIAGGRMNEDETLATIEQGSPIMPTVRVFAGPFEGEVVAKPAECGPGCPCGREKRTPRPATTAEAAEGGIIPGARKVPTVAPFGVNVTPGMVQEVWDTFVKPSQAEDAPPQSAEMRVLMAILRWADAELVAAEAATDGDQ